MEKIMKEAIDKCLEIIVKYKSDEKGVITRRCIPFDIGLGSIDNYKFIRYHFYSLDSPKRSDIISIEPNNIINLEITNRKFDPKDYVTWKKISWKYPRDWGIFS